METRKIFQKVAYALIGLSVAVLIGISIYQYTLIRNLSDTAGSDIPAATETTDDTNSKLMVQAEAGAVKGAVPPAAGEGRGLSDELEVLNYQLEAAEEEADMAHAELADERDKQAELAENTRALQKKILQDPAMKSMIQATMKSNMDVTYGALYARLGLSGEQLESFKELLLDQQMAALDISQEILGESPSDEKKAEIRQLMKDYETEFNEKISSFLGQEKFDTFQAFQERITERQTVTPFFDSLGPDEKLTEAQQEQLIDAMYEERKAVAAQYGTDSDEIETALNEETIANAMESLNRTYDGYTAVARNILSESQASQFETYMQSRREMMEMSVKMAQQLYGGE